MVVKNKIKIQRLAPPLVHLEACTSGFLRAAGLSEMLWYFSNGLPGFLLFVFGTAEL